jgi:hypothetical protein
MTIRQHDRRNAESRRRLTELVERLDGAALRTPMGEHWTVAAGLLHLSFWDRFTLERWADAERAGLAIPRPVDDFVEDLINDTLTPILLVGAVERVGEQVLEAAQAVDDHIARLPAATVQVVESAGRPRLIDRSIHRLEHVAEIENLLA